MKQILAIIATVTIYLGSVLLIDSAIAKDHHAGAEDHSKSHKHKDTDRMRGHKGIGKNTLAFYLIKEIYENLSKDNQSKHHINLIYNHTHPNIRYITKEYDPKKNKFKNSILIDQIRDETLSKLKINYINKKSKYKIIHVSNFGQRQANRLYNISIAKKISNGFIRNGHDVINISDRDVVRLGRDFSSFNKGLDYFNTLLLDTIDHYKPDALVLGHVNNLNLNTLDIIKERNKNIRLTQWFEDNLYKDGPDPITNKNNFLKYIDYLDHNFITSDPNFLGINKKFNCSYLPIPVDENIEYLKCYQNENPIKDLFFTMSHGVNKGVLKRNKTDVREPFVKKLILDNPEIIFDIYGYKNKQPIWSNDFYDAIYKSKMALNLSRINNVKYYSSNRIASLIGNGILTFVDIKTRLNDFFNYNEVVFYKNINDLSEKLKFYKENKYERNLIAKKGKIKYFKIFNNNIIADYICARLFEKKAKKNLSWMK